MVTNSQKTVKNFKIILDINKKICIFISTNKKAMKNLIKAFQKEQRQQRKYFVENLKDFNDIEATIANWRIKPLLTPAKKRASSWSDIKELKGYLLKRFDLRANKSMQEFVYKVNGDIKYSGSIVELKINVTWTKSATWGANPSAEIYFCFKDKDGQIQGNTVYSGSITGCGYDKESTAIARALNQIEPLIDHLYKIKEKNVKKSNHEIFGYGSGHGLLPNFEGGVGVGVSCYPAIFAKLGLTWSCVANGKNFTVYRVCQN